MRITIEPTETISGMASDMMHPTASATFPTDEPTIDDIIPMLRGLLVIYGFQPETIDEYLGS